MKTGDSMYTKILRMGIFLLAPVVCLGWESAGKVTAVRRLTDGVELSSGKVAVRITALSSSVVRVRYARNGTFPDKVSFAVVPETGFHAPEVKLTETPEMLVLSTGTFNIRVEKATMRIVFEENSGKVILADHLGDPVSWNGTEFRVWKTMPPNEHYFGLGDRAGALDHRNQAFTMWNTDAFGFERGTDPIYKSIPFFVGMSGSSAYGVFADNTYWSSFDFGKEKRDAFSFGSEGGEIDYYFFYGPDPKNVVREYTQLTGLTPLPPLFMLGFQQSRYSYMTESRVREIAKEFRTRKIPADVIWLDIDYQKANAPFTIDRESFPHMEGMVQDLARDGFKIITITDLHIKKEAGYKPYDEGMAGDHFVKNPDGSVYFGKVWPGDSVFPDFTQSGTRKWWGSLYKDFVKMGIRGFWNDMNEPSVFISPEKTMPLDTVHRVEDRKTDHREIHNVFGMENVRATYEGMLALTPDQRPVVMTRAAYAGTQRYASTWTGDNTSTWSHIRLSLPMLLNLGVSGYPLAGDDIGGYSGSPSPELLTRWIELGAFNPIFRDHTGKGTADQEPWAHGREQEAIRQRYIETRYRLLPYIYTSMEETSRTGLPLMRPMFLEFPSQSDFQTNETEYMFGHDLLVAPAISEMMDAMQVSLPAGQWYDYWTGDIVRQTGPLTLSPKLDELPVFVRAGAILPQQPVVQNVEEVPQGPLELRVYPGPECHGTLYADDGNTFAYQRGVFYRTEFSCSATPGSVEVRMSNPEGTYVPWWKEQRVMVFGVTKKPRQVKVDGVASQTWQFDGEHHTFSITSEFSKKEHHLQIEF
ncbi:MAG: glycoside hydrolase family 31 protein [Candidatus Acidiferrum sp.]